MFRIIPFFITLVIFVACSDSDSPAPPEEVLNGILLGDESFLLDLPTDVILDHNAYQINDTAFTDTLTLDVDGNEFFDIQLVYIEKLPSAEAERPVEEELIMNLSGTLMFVQVFEDGGPVFTFPKAAFEGDTLNHTLDWEWFNSMRLFHRVRNQTIGIDYQDPSFNMAIYHPSTNQVGWINFSIIYDDFYFQQLVINEIGLGPIPEED